MFIGFAPEIYREFRWLWWFEGGRMKFDMLCSTQVLLDWCWRRRKRMSAFPQRNFAVQAMHEMNLQSLVMSKRQFVWRLEAVDIKDYEHCQEKDWKRFEFQATGLPPWQVETAPDLAALPVSRWRLTATGRCSRYMIEGSLEVKLPTIWTDGKAEVGESESRREEKEWEERRCRCAKR